MINSQDSRICAARRTRHLRRRSLIIAPLHDFEEEPLVEPVGIDPEVVELPYDIKALQEGAGENASLMPEGSFAPSPHLSVEVRHARTA